MTETIVITGASRGVGRAIAVRLAGPGFRLVLHGRDPAWLAGTAAEVEARGGRPEVVTGDLGHPSGVAALVDAIGRGGVRVLVNNAGVAVVKPVAEITSEEWDRCMAVGVTAPFLLVKALFDRLAPGASVVNVLSVAARRGFAGWSAYCASKFALEGFSQSLREEFRGRGVRVINIYPTATDTGLWDQIPGEWDRSRMLPPAEVAEAVAFAISRPPDVLVETVEVGDVSGTL
jgi:NAD(P)-dependent dehydrogenase (short-subunit alcohol dehydrogenase family)